MRERQGISIYLTSIVFKMSHIYTQFRPVKSAMRDVNNNGRVHYYYGRGVISIYNKINKKITNTVIHLNME